jgi:uncharacterized damage-inducible protein DinB
MATIEQQKRGITELQQKMKRKRCDVSNELKEAEQRKAAKVQQISNRRWLKHERRFLSGPTSGTRGARVARETEHRAWRSEFEATEKDMKLFELFW